MFLKSKIIDFKYNDMIKKATVKDEWVRQLEE